MAEVDVEKLKVDLEHLIGTLRGGGASTRIVERLAALQGALDADLSVTAAIDGARLALDQLLTRAGEKTAWGGEITRKQVEDIRQSVVFLREQVTASQQQG